MNLIRMIDPSTLGHMREAKVHYAAPNNRELFCGLGQIYREVDGERFQIWHQTKRPVNCVSCTKRLETVVRFQINGLNSEQLEDLLGAVESFRGVPLVIGGEDAHK